MGIRIIRNGCLGFAYTSDLSWTALREAVDAALANARVASSDPFNNLPRPPAAYAEMNLGDPRPEGDPPGGKDRTGAAD